MWNHEFNSFMDKIFVDCRSTVLNCSVGQIFREYKFFVIGQKTSKSAKISPSKNLGYAVLNPLSLGYIAVTSIHL